VRTVRTVAEWLRGARRFCEELMKEGLLCKETHDHVIRFAPPLIVRKKDLNWAYKRIKQVFKRLELERHFCSICPFFRTGKRRLPDSVPGQTPFFLACSLQ